MPNGPYRAVQRGRNRKVVFLVDQDYQYYWGNLKESKTELSIKLYARYLMANHIHWMVEPEKDAWAISTLMKRINGRQAAYC